MWDEPFPPVKINTIPDEYYIKIMFQKYNEKREKKIWTDTKLW